MKINLCDACGKHMINHDSGRTIGYAVHIEDMMNGIIPGYSDLDGNSISGRETSWEVCNKCYNEIMTPMVRKFHMMRGEAIATGKFKEIKLD